MIITKETKERFVKMLEKNQIIMIQCNRSGRKTYDFKFIGSDGYGKWDFTPMVAEISGYPSNKDTAIKYLAVRSLDGEDVICNTLLKLHEEGLFDKFSSNGYSLYNYVRGHISTFFI